MKNGAIRTILRRILAWLRIGRPAAGSHALGSSDVAKDEAAILVRAGEIARQAGRRQEAMSFYGRATDSCLQAGLTRKAEALSRTVIDIEPKVIRARYTLTALAVARNDVRNARKQLTEYMVAVALSNAEPIAVPHLLELASSTARPAMRELVAEALRRADRPDLAEGVLHGTAAPARRTDRSRAVGAALKGPGDVDMDALTPT